MAANYLFEDTQFFDNNGNPLAGGKISFFAAGTTTPVAAFTDATGLSPLPNPAILDSAGRLEIWLSETSYKIVIATSAGITLETIDNYNAGIIAGNLTEVDSLGDINMLQPTAANAATNQNSNILRIKGAYWNGSISVDDIWSIRNVVGSGTSPTTSLQFSHSGSSGAASITLPAAVSVNSLSSSGAIIGTSGNFGGGAVSGGAASFSSLAVSGNFAIGQLDGRFYIDGIKYPQTVAGVQSAINDACTASSNAGGVVYLPGVISVPAQTTGTEVIKVPCSVSVIGEGGQGSIFLLAPGTTSTIPVFRLTATLGLFSRFENIQIQSSGAATAGDAFLVDPGTTGPPAGQSFLTFRNVSVLPGHINGFDINTTGNPAFAAGWLLEHNEFQNGVRFTNVADSFLAFHNIFRTAVGSTHACLEATTVAGAAHFTILNNNMSCDGGEILIHGSIQPKILYNQIEHVAPTNKPAIYLQADTAAINGAEILGNNVNCHTAALDCIKLGSGVNLVSDTRIEGNTITPVTTAGGNGITITASGTKTKIGPNAMGSAGNAQMNDGGDHTSYYANSGIVSKPGAFFFAPADGLAALTLQRNSATQSVPVFAVNNELGAGLMTVDATGHVLAPLGSASAVGHGFIGFPNSGLFADASGNPLISDLSTAKTYWLGSVIRNDTGILWGWTSASVGSGNALDTNLSRNQAGIVQIGTGETANANGTLKAGAINIAGTGVGTGTTVAATISGSSAATGGLQVFKGQVGVNAGEMFRAEPSDNTVRAANLQINALSGGLLTGTLVAALTSAGNFFGNGVTLGANQTFTFPPQILQSAHADNTVSLNSANTLITWTPLAAVTLKRIDATIQGVQANCTVAPKIRVTDGTTSIDLSIPNATTSFSVTATQNYAAVPLSITTVAGTCTTAPQGVNVTATFLSQ